MTTTIKPSERKVTCDRCGKDITKEKPRITQSGRLITTTTTTTEKRVMRKAAITGGGRDVRVLSCEIDFCESCWWEFDRLFCQGQAIPLADGVREQPADALARVRQQALGDG